MSRILECKEPLHFHHDGCPACSEVCNSCYEHELVCDCEGKVCKLECNHCDLDYIQTSIYGSSEETIVIDDIGQVYNPEKVRDEVNNEDI